MAEKENEFIEGYSGGRRAILRRRSKARELALKLERDRRKAWEEEIHQDYLNGKYEPKVKLGGDHTAEQVRAEHIQMVLIKYGFNKKKSEQVLNISRKTLLKYTV